MKKIDKEKLFQLLKTEKQGYISLKNKFYGCYCVLGLVLKSANFIENDHTFIDENGREFHGGVSEEVIDSLGLKSKLNVGDLLNMGILTETQKSRLSPLYASSEFIAWWKLNDSFNVTFEQFEKILERPEVWI